jgi:23S rRNA-/tRNA-specific pseudouridylate synthase
MAKPNFTELPACEPIPILYEDHSALAIDKPPGKGLPKLGNTCIIFP